MENVPEPNPFRKSEIPELALKMSKLTKTADVHNFLGNYLSVGFYGAILTPFHYFLQRVFRDISPRLSRYLKKCCLSPKTIPTVWHVQCIAQEGQRWWVPQWSPRELDRQIGLTRERGLDDNEEDKQS